MMKVLYLIPELFPSELVTITLLEKLNMVLQVQQYSIDDLLKKTNQVKIILIFWLF